jgi:uncharacterized membrane protein
MISMQAWFYWALFSAVFASLTAIFAKIGLEGVDSDFATLIRTVIILFAIMSFVYYTGKWSDPFALHRKTWVSDPVRIGHGRIVALLFSRIANRRGRQSRAGR